MTPEEAYERLKHSVETDRLAQAYVLVGNPRGEAGALAENLLSLIHCTAAKKPCGKCAACGQVRRHAHPDMLWIEPESKSRRILIAQVRDIQQRICQTPLVGEWKSCVIVSADRLQEQASNAFLKTLEEPAGHSLFLLLTDSPQFLLPTIASRCQEVVIGTGQSEAPEPWRSRLLEIMAEEMDFGPGAASGGGSPLAGMARAARVGRMLREVKAAAEEEVEESLSAEAEEEKEVVEARIAARYREIRSAIMRSLLLWYRDILLLVCEANEGGLRHREFAEVLRRRAAALDCRRALRNVEIVETMHRQMERNLPDATVLGWGFGDLSV